MGVNMAGFCIVDDEVVRRAAEQEIIRRYYKTRCLLLQGLAEKSEIYKLELLINSLGISTQSRPVVGAALKRGVSTGGPCMALQLEDGRVVTGKTTPLLSASAALLLNALKELGGLSHNLMLISPNVIEPIQALKEKHMGNQVPGLHTDEILIALAISATMNPAAALAMQQLSKLHACEAHSTVILSSVDEDVFQKLGINITCEPQYQSNRLFYN
jgi:uncharacterized protein (UPF0371 family)